MKLKFSLIIFLLMEVSVLKAQYDVSFTNYWALQSFYNPAVAGSKATLNVQAAYAMQMTGFENAPATMYAGADMPLFFWGPQHGVGAGFLNDKIGLFSHQKFYFQYAYHKQHIFGGVLSAGMQLNMISESFDGSKLNVEDSNDPAFPTSTTTGSAFDLNVGLYYNRKDWYAGASVMHCTSPTVFLGTDKTYEISISPSYYLMGGYNIKLKNPFVTVQPSVMVMSDLVTYRADMTCRLTYTTERHRMYGGISYSPTNSVSFLLGGDFHGVSLGYSYEWYTSAIGAKSGSHELIMGYQTDLNVFKKGKNKHKSVRIL